MRDYDPTTGRYLQGDPLGLVDGASVYGYALQNPGRYVDPRGEAVWAPFLFWVGVGVVIDYLSDDDGCFTLIEFGASIAANALNPFQKAKSSANIATRITKHGQNRHVDRTKYPSKSKYAKPSQRNKLIDKTMKNPDRVEIQGDRVRYEKDYGRNIGTDGETTHVVVVDRRTGKTVTDFPKR